MSIDGDTGRDRLRRAATPAVQFLYPGAVIVFLAGADPACSSMRVRAVDYTQKRFSFHPPRNARPAAGSAQCACRPVMRCDRQGVTGHGPDGWLKTVSALVWIDRWPAFPPEGLAQMRFSAGAA